MLVFGETRVASQTLFLRGLGLLHGSPWSIVLAVFHTVTGAVNDCLLVRNPNR